MHIAQHDTWHTVSLPEALAVIIITAHFFTTGKAPPQLQMGKEKKKVTPSENSSAHCAGREHKNDTHKTVFRGRPCYSCCLLMSDLRFRPIGFGEGRQLGG